MSCNKLGCIELMVFHKMGTCNIGTLNLHELKLHRVLTMVIILYVDMLRSFIFLEYCFMLLFYSPSSIRVPSYFTSYLKTQTVSKKSLQISSKDSAVSMGFSAFATNR